MNNYTMLDYGTVHYITLDYTTLKYYPTHDTLFSASHFIPCNTPYYTFFYCTSHCTVHYCPTLQRAYHTVFSALRCKTLIMNTLLFFDKQYSASLLCTALYSSKCTILCVLLHMDTSMLSNHATLFISNHPVYECWHTQY